MDEQDNIALFEQYLLHQMTDTERLDFEQKLASNPDLAAQLAEHKIVLGVGKRLAQQNLTDQFAKWEDELTAKEAQAAQNKPVWQRLALLFALALLGVLAYVAFRKPVPPTKPDTVPAPPVIQQTPVPIDTTSIQQKTAPKPTDVVENKSKPAPPKPPSQPITVSVQLLFAKNEMAAVLQSEKEQYRQLRSRSTEITADQEVLELISNGAYRQAAEKAEKLQDPGLRSYYLGMASFHLADYPAAQQYFEAWKSQAMQTHKADWCALLACLAQNRDCTDLRDAIKLDSAHPYRDALWRE
jgi:hypothetical protein